MSLESRYFKLKETADLEQIHEWVLNSGTNLVSLVEHQSGDKNWYSVTISDWKGILFNADKFAAEFADMIEEAEWPTEYQRMHPGQQ